MKLPETDSVAICRLSSDTRHAIAEALFDSGFDMGQSWYDFDLCCGIFFRLKYSQDDPKLFPKGKWATLQRLEQLIEQAVRKPEVKG